MNKINWAKSLDVEVLVNYKIYHGYFKAKKIIFARVLS